MLTRSISPLPSLSRHFANSHARAAPFHLMHDQSGLAPPTSPYANMNIPVFDRLESSELSSLAQREYESMITSDSDAGLVLATREADKAFQSKAPTGKTNEMAVNAT
ncbi:hypothetical protein JCM11641_008025 [Rhodosporidiobolus odoratus]